MTSKRDRILGSLIGAAIGDAMGSVTEARTTQAILQRHGGYVREIRRPPYDTFSRINWKGAVTDDFSMVYLIAKAFIEKNGVVTPELFEDVLIEWFDLPQYSIQSGPNSRDRIKKLRGEPYNTSRDHLAARHDLVTNGTAMKSSPIGMINPGNLDRAIEETIIMCMPTHPTALGISGGAAISCAVAEAMAGSATKESVIDAGLYGAAKGYERSKSRAVPSSGARIERRIHMAVEIAVKHGKDFEKLLYEMASVVGTGYSCAESPAAVFGLFLAAKDPLEFLIMSTNVGGDTDTLATMGGAIFGAFSGAAAFEPDFQRLIEENNYSDPKNTVHFDLDWIADGLARIIDERNAK